MNEPNKQEKREQRKQEKEQGRAGTRRIQKVKRVLTMTLLTGVAAWGVIAFGGYVSKSEVPKEGDIITQRGIHWHAELKIIVKGQEQEIPANIGIGVTHKPIHTHDADNVIHMEFDGLVMKDDVRLKHFFENWEKKFDGSCVFEFCNGNEGTVKMFVNGQPSNEFENYVMKDGDKIEIRYE